MECQIVKNVWIGLASGPRLRVLIFGEINIIENKYIFAMSTVEHSTEHAPAFIFLCQIVLNACNLTHIKKP